MLLISLILINMLGCPDNEGVDVGVITGVGVGVIFGNIEIGKTCPVYDINNIITESITIINICKLFNL